MAALSLLRASENEMTSAVTRVAAMPSPPGRPTTANEFAAMLTDLALHADAALLHGDVESHVRAMCQQLIRASKWIVDAEKQLEARDAEVIALREALEVIMIKRSDAEAAAMVSDTESSRSDIDSEFNSDSEHSDAELVNGDAGDESFALAYNSHSEYVEEDEEAQHSKLKQELVQSSLRCVELSEKVQSLEKLVEEQRKLLSLANDELAHCRAESRWLRSDVSWLVEIKRELEQKQDILVTRVQALELSEAELSHELKKISDEKVLWMTDYETVVREYEELVRRMESDLVDLPMGSYFVAAGEHDDDILVAEHNSINEYVESSVGAVHELEQELASRGVCCAHLCEKVQSLEKFVEEQRKLLSLANDELAHCRTESRWLRSDVSWLVEIKRELEQKQDELVKCVQVLQLNEADLRRQLEKTTNGKALRMSGHEDVVREYEELVRRMESDLVDLQSEFLFVDEEPKGIAKSTTKSKTTPTTSSALVPTRSSRSRVVPAKIDSPRAARCPVDTLDYMEAHNPVLKTSAASSLMQQGQSAARKKATTPSATKLHTTAAKTMVTKKTATATVTATPKTQTKPLMPVKSTSAPSRRR